jgi:hypothetical protein
MLFEYKKIDNAYVNLLYLLFFTFYAFQKYTQKTLDNKILMFKHHFSYNIDIFVLEIHSPLNPILFCRDLYPPGNVGMHNF